MSEIRVTVRYVNGTEATVPPAYWSGLPGEGVDEVDVTDETGTVRFRSQSMYWLYTEGEAVVVGSASLHYDPNPITEVVFRHGVPQEERKLEFCPDLFLKDVKLGHWWIGTDRPVEQ